MEDICKPVNNQETGNNYDYQEMLNSYMSTKYHKQNHWKTSHHKRLVFF